MDVSEYIAKIPREVRVFNLPYKILFVDQINYPDNDAHPLGNTCCSSLEITIATKSVSGRTLGVEIIRGTLIHELVHAMLGESCFLEENNKECFVEILSKLIIEIIPQIKELY